MAEDDELVRSITLLAAEGLTDADTLSLGSVLRRELGPKAKGRPIAQATAGELILAMMKVRAASAMMRMARLDPTDAAAVAAAQAAILAYSQIIADAERVVQSADQILDLLNEAERHALANELGLDPETIDAPSFADQE